MSLRTISHALPTGYTELEYLQSTGTQYIDTGENTSTDTELEGKITLSTLSNQMLWANNNTAANRISCYLTNTGSCNFGDKTSSNNNLLNYLSTTTPSIIKENSDGIFIDGTKRVNFGGGTITGGDTMYIFTAKNTGATGLSGKMYYCTIKKNNTLVRNFIPAKNSENKPGMYDTISRTFFTNAATSGDDFTPGPEITTPTKSLKEIHELYKKNSGGTGVDYIGEIYQVSNKNLFDMRYDVSYQGSYPNITEVAGGKSTEWIETTKFTNPYGYYSLNPATPSTLCVFGLVYSNDKSTLLYRDGRRNTGDLPANTQYYGTTAVDKSYTYVKFYVSSWDTMNNAGVYISQTEYEPYMLHTFSAGYDTTVSGVSPLTLTNSRAKNTNWKIDGQSSQDGTPTPTNPVDVNGCGNSGLPNGYKKLEYIQSSGTQYIDTGKTLDTSTDTLEVKYENTGGTAPFKWAFGSYRAGGSSIGITTGSGTTSSNMYYSSVQNIDSSYFTGSHTLLADSNGVSMDGTNVVSYVNFTTSSNLYLFATNNSGAASNNGNYKIYSYKQTRNGSDIINFIPAQRKSDNVIGMYDTVTNTFFTNAATSGDDFIAGPEDTSYVVPILQANNCGMVDLGTIENLTYREDLGEGIFFVNTNWWGNPKKELGVENLYLNGYTISESGAAGMGDMTICGHPTAYVLYIRDTRYNDVESFKAAMSGKYLYYQRTTDTTWNTPTITNITLPAPLQKIGTYKDTIESDGTLTRGVGVKVLDGTEDWSTYTYQSSPNAYYITVSDMIDTEASTSSSLFMNTHLQWASGVWASSDIGYAVSTMKRMFFRRNTTDTIDTWKAWLASEAAAGHPVTVYYPLATETETTIQVPVLSTSKGTNYISAETNIKPSNMEFTYRKKTQ